MTEAELKLRELVWDLKCKGWSSAAHLVERLSAALAASEAKVAELRNALERIAAMKTEDFYVTDDCGYDNMAQWIARDALFTAPAEDKP